MLTTPTGPEPGTETMQPEPPAPEVDAALHPEIDNPILHVDGLSLWSRFAFAATSRWTPARYPAYARRADGPG